MPFNVNSVVRLLLDAPCFFYQRNHRTMTDAMMAAAKDTPFAWVIIASAPTIRWLYHLKAGRNLSTSKDFFALRRGVIPRTCMWFNNHGDRKSPMDRVVGPLPNWPKCSWLINQGDPNHLRPSWDGPNQVFSMVTLQMPMPASLAKGRNDGLAGSWLVGNSWGKGCFFFQAKTSWKQPSHRDKTWCFGLFLNPPLERIYPPLLAGFQRGCFFIHFIVIKSRDNKLLRSAGQNFDQIYSSSCFLTLPTLRPPTMTPPPQPHGILSTCVSVGNVYHRPWIFMHGLLQIQDLQNNIPGQLPFANGFHWLWTVGLKKIKVSQSLTTKWNPPKKKEFSSQPLPSTKDALPFCFAWVIRLLNWSVVVCPIEKKLW